MCRCGILYTKPWGQISDLGLVNWGLFIQLETKVWNLKKNDFWVSYKSYGKW